MPRRGKITGKRKTPKDAVYGSEMVQKFINKLMYSGKKSIAETIVYGAMQDAADKLKKEPLALFLKALEGAKPIMEVRPRRVGGATYQVPIEVREERAVSLAMKWLREYARERAGKSMIEKLSAEFVDAVNGTGGAVKKREDTHKVAESNRAFAHFRW